MPESQHGVRMAEWETEEEDAERDGGSTSSGSTTQSAPGRSPLPRSRGEVFYDVSVCRRRQLTSQAYSADISNTNPFDISQMSSNDLWNFASSSNYVWPTGFTPEGQASGSTSNINHQAMNQQSLVNNFQLPGMNEPTIGQFMNTSPGTDMRLINALESGAAYIEGNPAEDDDIELFYYRFVSQSVSLRAVWESGSHSAWLTSPVRCYSCASRHQSHIPQTAKTQWHDKRCTPA